MPHLITLPADPASSLDWGPLSEEKGIFYLDFGWKTIDPFDTAAFNSHLLAVMEFSRQFPDAKKVVLAKTTGQFSQVLAPTEKMEQRSQESGLQHELFCAKLFSEYLHRLASALPDETIPVIMVEIADQNAIADLMLLFCKRRFEHFELSFSNITLPIEGNRNMIISLPQDTLYQPSLYLPLFTSLSDYKCIPEELLNEHWDEVEAIIVDPETLGPSGRRMLYGFEAAGGLIVSMRGPLGFSNETSLDEFGP